MNLDTEEKMREHIRKRQEQRDEWWSFGDKPKPFLAGEYADRDMDADDLGEWPDEETREQQAGQASVWEDSELETLHRKHKRAKMDQQWEWQKALLIAQLENYSEPHAGEVEDKYVYAVRNIAGMEKAECAIFLRKVADYGLPFFRDIQPDTKVLLHWLADMIWRDQHKE